MNDFAEELEPALDMFPFSNIFLCEENNEYSIKNK